MLNDILERLYTIEHIPSHPLMKAKVNTILLNFNNDADAVEKLISILSYDPSLTIELLKIANSDSFGFKNKISSIKHALLVLDRDLIRLVIEQHPVIPDLKLYHSKIEEYFKKLIRHTIEVQVIVQNMRNGILKEMIKDENLIEELITASTLHDIGIFFLLIYFPDYYEDIVERIQEVNTTQKRKESYIPDHSLLSSILCESWNLPPSIRTSIAFHHYPFSGDNRYSTIAEILYVADSISTSFYDLYYSNDVYTVDERIIMRKNLLDIIEKLGIDITAIAELRVQTFMQTKDIYEEFGL